VAYGLDRVRSLDLNECEICDSSKTLNLNLITVLDLDLREDQICVDSHRDSYLLFTTIVFNNRELKECLQNAPEAMGKLRDN
jgi:hypothetical protein